MARYLVIAHETVTNPVLSERLQEIQEQDPGAEFTLLVPATPVRHLLFLHGNEHDATAVANKLTMGLPPVWLTLGVCSSQAASAAL